MARPWVKLWTKQLDNPEIAELPDNLYRRWIEIMLLAGRNDADGQLQPVKKMAYLLHISVAQMSEDLTSLSAIEVVHQDDAGNWHITNWKKHQYSESVDRVRKYREKARYSNENSARYSNDLRSESAVPVALHDSTSTSISIFNNSILFKLYESEIGMITPRMADVLAEAWDEYPHEWFQPAFDEAIRNNARKWNYIEAILKRWKSDGFQSRNGKGGGKKESIFDRERAKIAAEEAAKHGE